MEILPGALRSPFLTASRLYYQLSGGRQGPPILEEDWDTLLILDGCRYDLFERRCSLNGRLERRRSLGSTTDQFVRANFDSDTFEDLVYVSANPRVDLAFEGAFHASKQVWRDGWDDDLETVPPEPVVEVAHEAHEEYPHKRIIVHFIQPHAPFIGDIGQERLREHSTLADHRPSADGTDTDNIWDLVAVGAVDRDDVLQAYEENLNLVLGAVVDLLDSINGRTVITSDHGNLVGERLPPFFRRSYGHPTGLYAPGLVEVPWFVVESDTRREIVAGETFESDDVTVTESTKEKLKSLGYR